MSSRRDFIVKTVGALTITGLSSSLIGFLQGCASNPTGLSSSFSGIDKISATVSDNKIIITIDSSSPLNKTGGVLLLIYNNGDNGVLLQRISDTEIKALTAVCTHEGCIIDLFSSEESAFGCPCHSSKFNLNGGVVQGPADDALKSFSTTFQNDVLTIFV